MDQNQIKSLDIAKFIMSIMVVAIHTQLFPMILYPWLRLAVPIFFLISSYFFFRKINLCDHNKEQEYSVLRCYIKRNALLYFFWLIATLPFVLLYRSDWFCHGILQGVLTVIHNILFGSTFTGSWFIAASVIAAAAVFFASRKLKLNNTVLCIIAVCLHILLVLRSGYGRFWKDIEWIAKTVAYYESVFGSGINGFPVAICYFIFGKILAERVGQTNIRSWIIICSITLPLLWFEWKYVYEATGVYNNDIYLMLPINAISLFNIIKCIPVKCNTAFFRKSSIIIYASHGAVMRCVKLIGILLNVNIPWFQFVLTVLSCLMISIVIIHFSKNTKLSFLRCSY